jgi:lysophospholipase L1-like esterase
MPGGGGATFDPLSRFEAGEEGVLFDPSDLSTLFQDAAGTVPVTATGQTVKRINDRSGRGHHVANAAANWTLQNDGVNNYLQTDGAVRLDATAFAWGSDKLTFFGAIKADTGGLSKHFCWFGGPFVTASWAVETNIGGLLLYRRGSGAFGGRYTASIGTATSVISGVADLSGATQATENPFLRVDGVQPTLTNAGTADTGGGNFGTQLLSLGGSTTWFTGRIYAFGAVNTASTQTQLEDLERWCASKSGVTVPFESAPAPSFLDTGAVVQESGYVRSSAFSRASYQTAATKILVTLQSPARTSLSTMIQLGVYVDGVFQEAILPTSTAAMSQIVNLPAGTKTVDFVGGLQTAPAQAVPALGTYFVGASANAAMTVLTPTPTNRLLIYGDSIAVGANADTPPQAGWGVLVRNAYAPDSVAFEAFGFRSLALDADTAPKRAALVSTLAAYSPARIWLAIGTNDYGLNKWTAANFQTAYAALLDDLHAALPSALIYAQTPLVRTTETANSLGDTLGAYRTAISNAVSTRTAYTTLVDGTAILTTGDLADGVHPTTAGHAIYAAYVETVLGI